MIKIITILGLALISLTVFGSVGSDLRSEKAELYKVKQLICGTGTLDESKANQMLGQVSNSWFIADTESRGGVLQKSGDIIAQILTNNGAAKGICNNNGSPTVLILIYEKVTQ